MTLPTMKKIQGKERVEPENLTNNEINEHNINFRKKGSKLNKMPWKI